MPRIWKHVVAIVALAAAVGLWSLPPSLARPPGGSGGGGSAAAYTIIPFMPAGSASTFGYVADINDQGQVVGRLNFADASTKAIHLDIASGMYTTLLGGQDAGGINNLNQIVGWDGTNSLYWSSPTTNPVVLPPLDGDSAAYAHRINDDGIVCGESEHMENGVRSSMGIVWRVWFDQNGTLQLDGPIALPSIGQDNWTTDINQVLDGAAQVSGNAGGEAAVWTVELNSDGTLASPGTPTLVGTLGLQNPSWSIGYGINNFVDVCGMSDSLPFVAFADQQPTALSVPRDTFHAVAYDINDRGETVGYVEVKYKGYTNPPGQKYAFLWKNGQRIDLATQIPSRSGWDRLSQAYVINNSGIIGGWGRFDVQNRGFVLIPNAP